MIEASIAQIVERTEAEGPGTRFAVWFQGCPLRCPGCCNPEFLPFKGGEATAVTTLCQRLRDTHESMPLEGVSLLGGEPFAHVEAAALFAEYAQSLGLGVMIYTGFTLEALQAKPEMQRLLNATDLLVDGPYVREQPEPRRRWIGSTNQRLHFLTQRYDPTDDCWTQRNTLEIRVIQNEVSINGFPAIDAKGLWKGWTRKRGA